MKKAREAEFLIEKIKNLENEAKIKELEFQSTIKRYQANIQYSRDANLNLKNDYDLLQ